MALSKEYDEGAKFALQNGFYYRNPYPTGSAQYNDFERGWSQEIKKNYEAVTGADARRKKDKSSISAERNKTKWLIHESYRKEKDGY